MAPEQARGDRPPRPPRFGNRRHFSTSGAVGQAEQVLCRKLQSEVANRPDIGPTHGRQQVDFGRPGANARQGRESGPNRVVGQVPKPREIARARRGGAGGGPEGTGLGPRKAQAAERGLALAGHGGGIERMQGFCQPRPDGFPRLERDELVRDDAQQALEAIGHAAQGWLAVAGDNRRKTWLRGHEGRHRLGNVGIGFDTSHWRFDLSRQTSHEQAMSQPVLRFAPSPNGELHMGHAYSALLNATMARDLGGRFLLRIEDTDQTRCRPEFTAGILRDLAWLGLAWEEPVRIQSEHFDAYEANLARLRDMGRVYPCFCSRKVVAGHALAARDPDGQPRYGGTCRGLPQAEAAARIASGEQHGWRLDMASCGDADAAVWGDMTIAKRNVGSFYHIAVVTDDYLQGVTHVVRGQDMEAATPVHRLLQRLLGFPSPHYHHHRLILDESGRKLSKSTRSTSIAALREAGVTAADIRNRLGFG